MPKFLLGESIVARRRVYFTCRNTTDVNDRLQSSDMTTFTCKLSRNGGASSNPSSIVPVQIDATNQKGCFYLELGSADLDTLGESVLTISNSGGAKTMRVRDIKLIVTATDDQYVTPPVDITKVSGTAIPSPTTAGVLRVDVKAMETGVLTNTAIASNAISVAKISDDSFALAKFAADAKLSLFGLLDTGTAQAGSGSGITLRAAASALNGAYADAIVAITSGTGALQINQIDTYAGGTKIATMKRAWSTAPDATSAYVVLASGAAGSAPTAVANAAAVWAATQEGSTQYGDAMRLMTAVLAGKVQDFTSGTLIFLAMDGSKPRLTVVTDQTGRRTSTPNDLTP